MVDDPISDDGQTIELEMSDGRSAKFFPSVVEIVYNCPRSGDYLGNVG